MLFVDFGYTYYGVTFGSPRLTCAPMIGCEFQALGAHAHTGMTLTKTMPTWAPPTHHGGYATMASLAYGASHSGPAASVVAVQRAYSGAT